MVADGTALARPAPDWLRSAAWWALVLAVVSTSMYGVWSTLATLALVVHLGYMVYVPLGGFLALRRIHWLWPHLAAAAWGVFGAIRPGVPCPITQLEKWLLVQAGEPPYSGSFVNYYLDGTVWPDGRAGDVWLATAALVAVSYVVVLRQVCVSRLLRVSGR